MKKRGKQESCFTQNSKRKRSAKFCTVLSVSGEGFQDEEQQREQLPRKKLVTVSLLLLIFANLLFFFFAFEMKFCIWFHWLMNDFWSTLWFSWNEPCFSRKVVYHGMHHLHPIYTLQLKMTRRRKKEMLTVKETEKKKSAFVLPETGSWGRNGRSVRMSPGQNVLRSYFYFSITKSLKVYSKLKLTR